MYWAITILFALVLTTFTGSLLTVVWYVIGRQLEKVGFINIVFQFMKVVAVFWCLPLTYVLLLFINQNTNEWNGVVFIRTPMTQFVTIVLAGVWFLVAMWGIAGYVRSNYRIWKNFRCQSYKCDEEVQGIFDEVCQKLHISPRAVDLRTSMRTEVAFIAGTFRMTVYVPLAADYYTEEELRVVFFHELTHYRQRDVWLKHVVIFAKKIHFFNPVIYWFAKLVEEWSEFSCDDAAYPRVGGIQPYFNTIVDLLTSADEEEEELSSCLWEEEELLVRRAKKAAESAKRKRKSKRLAALIVVGMALTSVVTVYGETRGIAILYREVFWETSIEEMEQENLIISGKEYVEMESDGSYSSQKGDWEQLESGRYRIDCQLEDGEIWISNTVSVQQGGKMSMSIMSDSSDTDMVAGIIEPNGKKRCVYGEGAINHQFELTSTGGYQIYVKNPSGQSQKVQGVVEKENK